MQPLQITTQGDYCFSYDALSLKRASEPPQYLEIVREDLPDVLHGLVRMWGSVAVQETLSDVVSKLLSDAWESGTKDRAKFTVIFRGEKPEVGQ